VPTLWVGEDLPDGASGGAFIGLQAAAEAPELYHGYIGVAQMVNQRASEKEAYDYMLQAFEKQGDRRMADRLGQSSRASAGRDPQGVLGRAR